MRIFFLLLAFLALSQQESSARQLETRRDRELNLILKKTHEASKQISLTEKSSQLNQLRLDYIERLRRPDWAAEIQLESLSGTANWQRSFHGLNAHLRTLLQFSENWQAQSSWSLAQSLSRFAPLQYRASSELAHLNSLWLTYGRMRSVSLSAGLVEEKSLLLDSSTRPLFSSLSVAIHPLEQKLAPESLQSFFELEHGWASFLDVPAARRDRVEVQRTRPRLRLNWKFPLLELSFVSGLEWYTDPQGKLRRVAGGRPNAFEESQTSTENKWRLFSFESQLRWQSSESSASLKFERVSNPPGASSIPAWSATVNGEILMQRASGLLSGLYGATYYRVPADALPAVRLPLGIHPSSQGVLIGGGLRYSSSQNPNNLYSLEFRRGLMRQLTPQSWLPCSTTEHPNSSDCRIDWVTLAWSLKLPTNL